MPLPNSALLYEQCVSSTSLHCIVLLDLGDPQYIAWDNRPCTPNQQNITGPAIAKEICNVAAYLQNMAILTVYSMVVCANKSFISRGHCTAILCSKTRGTSYTWQVDLCTVLQIIAPLLWTVHWYCTLPESCVTPLMVAGMIVWWLQRVEQATEIKVILHW